MTDDAARRLLRRLMALSDPKQRVAVLAEDAERLGMDAFADLLSVVLARAKTRRSEADQVALAALMGFLDSEHFDSERRAGLLTACRDGGHAALLRLLFTPTGRRAPTEERVPDYGTGRPLTLGERKSLARRPSRDVVERVVADPHPAVIRNVLQNPKLTEADVVRMVSKRPNYEKVLEQIYRHPKWAVRYPVRLALARNPYTPPAIALKLVPQLMRQDLEEMLGDRLLHPSVLVAIRRLLTGEIDEGEGGEEPTLH